MRAAPGRASPASSWALALVLPILPSSVAAQDVAGTWEVRWAQAVRIERDGSVDVRRWGDATLRLAVAGDSVEGEWATRTARELVTWTVSGTATDGRLRLTAMENDSNDPEMAMIERIDFDATVGDGALEGRIRLTMRGQGRESVPRPFSATPAGWWCRQPTASAVVKRPDISLFRVERAQLLHEPQPSAGTTRRASGAERAPSPTAP